MNGLFIMSEAGISFESRIQDAVRSLLQQIKKNDGEEFREYERYPFFRPVTIQSNNQDRQFQALTREISENSVGLLHEQRFRANEPIGMTIDYKSGYAATIPMVGVWCQPCGAGWYISGARLLKRSTTEDPIRFPKNLLGYFTQDIQQMTEKRIYNPYADRRCEERYEVTLPLTVTPVTDDLQPHDESLHTITCDISGFGISFFTRTKITSGLVSLEMRGLNGGLLLRGVMETLRCRPIGDYYLIGGKFISKRYFAV